MKLRTLLILQCVYAALGVGYNVVSYARTAMGHAPLSTTSPFVGAAVLLIYALCLLTGVYRKITAYRLAMAFFVVVLGYGGVVKHLLNYPDGLSLYYSLTAYVIAIGINVYGLVLNVIAASGRFRE